MNTDELRHRFTYHAPTGDQPKIYERIRSAALMLALDVDELCPESREKSLALTHLDEVVFWANSSIARNRETEA